MEKMPKCSTRGVRSGEGAVPSEEDERSPICLQIEQSFAVVCLDTASVPCGFHVNFHITRLTD